MPSSRPLPRCWTPARPTTRPGLALRKAELREALQTLRAPEDGVIQQMQVHTVGGVVQPAEPLMVLVPNDAPLEISAMVLNKDKGFVRPGQAAEIKVESFPFTKYGTIKGEVRHLSGDAIQDENQGLVYETRVNMNDVHIIADGEPVFLTPGHECDGRGQDRRPPSDRFPDLAPAALSGRGAAGAVTRPAISLARPSVGQILSPPRRSIDRLTGHGRFNSRNPRCPGQRPQAVLAACRTRQPMLAMHPASWRIAFLAGKTATSVLAFPGRRDRL